MEDIDALKAKHEKELAAALLCNEISATMPVPPKRVTTFDTKYSCPWVIYEVAGIAEAVELADKFNWLPIFYAKDGCAVVCPEELLGKYADHTELQFDGSPVLVLDTVAATYFNARLEFYTRIAERLVKVQIEMKTVPARIWVRVLGESHDRRRASVTKDYPSLHEDKRICWERGGDKSASASYIWGTEDTYRPSVEELIERMGGN